MKLHLLIKSVVLINIIINPLFWHWLVKVHCKTQLKPPLCLLQINFGHEHGKLKAATAYPQVVTNTEHPRYATLFPISNPSAATSRMPEKRDVHV